MKQLGFIPIICSGFLVLLTACTPNPTSQTPSQEFEAYLQHQFSLKPDDQHLYFLMPDNQCENCYLYDALKVAPLLNERLIIISGFPASNFKNFAHVYYDEANTLLELKLLNYRNVWITYREGKINRIIPMTNFYRQLDSLGGDLSN